MRKIQSVAVLLGMLVSLTACSVTQIGRQPREGDSLALSVALAAGYSPQRLRDSPGPLPENLNPAGGSAVGSAVGGLVDVGGLAATIASPLAGFTSLAGGAMAGAQILFLRTDAPPPEAGVRVLAWMPTDFVPGPDQAQDTLARLVGEAFAKGLDEAGLRGQYSHSIGERSYQSMTGRVRYDYAPFRMTVPPCTETGFSCRVEIGGSSRRPRIVETPSFVGRGPAYFFSTGDAAGIVTIVNDRRGTFPKAVAAYPFLEALVAASRHLPAWAYIYAGPTSVSYREPGTDRFVFLQAPLVLHQGRILPFIRGHESPVSPAPAQLRG